MLDAYIIDRIKREKEANEIDRRPHVEMPQAPDFPFPRGGENDEEIIRGIADITDHGRISIGSVLEDAA